jgi:hypothetical protein
MTSWVSYFLKKCLSIIALVSFGLTLFSSDPAHALGVEVTQARIESSDEGHLLSVSYHFELSDEIRDAIKNGIPMYFINEVEMVRSRWYWFGEKFKASQVTKITYNLWTRQFTANINNGLARNFPTLDEAMQVVLRPRRLLIAEKNTLSLGATYNVAVRLRLDMNQLSKPIQISTLGNSDWRVASEWKKFTYKVEEK